MFRAFKHGIKTDGSGEPERFFSGGFIIDEDILNKLDGALMNTNDKVRIDEVIIREIERVNMVLKSGGIRK